MAKIDVTRIEGYESMTPEQKLAALESFEYEDNASEIERLKNANSKANSEAAEWKRKHNALLTEEEQKRVADAEALEAALKRVEVLEREKTVSEYKSKYIALGYDEKMATETASALAAGDFEKVFANNEKFKADFEKRVRAEVLKDTPKPDRNQNEGTSVTKEQFDKMGYTERQKLFSENKALYDEFMNGGNE
jgi:hypothetical protein